MGAIGPHLNRFAAHLTPGTASRVGVLYESLKRSDEYSGALSGILSLRSMFAMGGADRSMSRASETDARRRDWKTARCTLQIKANGAVYVKDQRKRRGIRQRSKKMAWYTSKIKENGAV